MPVWLQKFINTGYLDAFIDWGNLVQNKLSFLYNVRLMRYIEGYYGHDELKEDILRKLRFIEYFDDCLVITDFTKFQEDGINAKLVGSGDSYSVTKTQDELVITITTDSTSGTRSVWIYKNFPQSVSKVFFGLISDGFKWLPILFIHPSNNSKKRSCLLGK